ncbi:hypothetical protein K431DRAFT_328150 [Polychaeton citri CBS 116435]|uniref:Apple domain-containing protein n=1 Tax=Polychaeton citri CBS 116435 TaxID=1314669 RepID=A0A9P4UQJ5_9PEZI|nr:hypothetical protein K431DRAFT_328150 [Polychaeton citri CBS 116435]
MAAHPAGFTSRRALGAGPQRLSALYQYHNAPEVAPTQGLEYDDTVYPVSDKFPVIHHDPYEPKYRGGGKMYESDNRPPRIIFGMKIKTFLLVLLLVIAIVVGAAVGGAVGGKTMNSDSGVPMPGYESGSASPTAAPPTSSAPTAITSTYAAPTPTYSPLNDCPNSNATAYTSSWSKQHNVPAGAGLKFAKFCSLETPLESSDVLSEGFVYTFDDCIELCASLNFHSGNGNCTVAAYTPGGSRPANCLVGSAVDVSTSRLTIEQGSNIAVLES